MNTKHESIICVNPEPHASLTGIINTVPGHSSNEPGGGGGSGNYILPIASNEKLGGIKVGNYLAIARDGKLTVNIAALSQFLSTSGTDKSYEHRQSVASTVWYIEHNLDKMPSVTIIDSAGSTLFGEIVYKDSNTMEIRFSSECTGNAYLN